MEVSVEQDLKKNTHVLGKETVSFLSGGPML